MISLGIYKINNKMVYQSLKIIVKKILRSNIAKIITNTYKKALYRLIYPLYQKGLVKYIRKKEKINIVFVASSISRWRYQNIYTLLSKHPRFKTFIVIVPFFSYTKDQQKNDIITLKAHFDSLGIQCYIGDSSTNNIIKDLSPDILFYPQPYDGIFNSQYDYRHFRSRLLCYYPYAFWMSANDWSYNMPLHNYAWKLFYSTELHRKDAQRIAFNKGRNVEVVGYPNADNFILRKHYDVWKPQAKRKKRVIWAPHFTIFTDDYVTQSNFLWMADFMLELTNKYADKIQFVFKPHPRLLTELYKHNDWGKDKATSYYKEWKIRENTQLEEGEFIDLFMTSDAMVHDSGSFCVEYHYSGKPVMYIADNFEEQLKEKGEFGKLAMRLHYIGKCKEDIINFIDNTILQGEDPMKPEREQFYKKFLLPPNGKSVAENTMNVFLKAFC